jgi:peptide-methionine (S)-S-oxide reductase
MRTASYVRAASFVAVAAAFLAYFRTRPRPLAAVVIAAPQQHMGALSSTSKMATSSTSASSAASALIESLTTTHPVVIFSKTYCPYCSSAKAAIANAGSDVAGFSPPHVVELNVVPDGSAIQQALAELTGRRTVPNVFIGGKTAGGGDDMDRLARSGVLKQMLRAAPEQLASSDTSKSQIKDMPVSDISDASKMNAGTTSDSAKSDEQLITFGAGCFWGVELAFQRAPGVVRTEVGFSNGDFTPVSYNAVCTGRTGHNEVVRVWFDSRATSLSALLALWESRHDVTSVNKQGNDRGTQYRSGVYFHGEEQERIILEWKEAAAARLSKPIVSEIASEAGYCPAEDYHQRYLEKGGQDASKSAASQIRCYG